MLPFSSPTALQTCTVVAVHAVLHISQPVHQVLPSFPIPFNPHSMFTPEPPLPITQAPSLLQSPFVPSPNPTSCFHPSSYKLHVPRRPPSAPRCSSLLHSPPLPFFSHDTSLSTLFSTTHRVHLTLPVFHSPHVIFCSPASFHIRLQRRGWRAEVRIC